MVARGGGVACCDMCPLPPPPHLAPSRPFAQLEARQLYALPAPLPHHDVHLFLLVAPRRAAPRVRVAARFQPRTAPSAAPSPPRPPARPRATAIPSLPPFRRRVLTTVTGAWHACWLHDVLGWQALAAVDRDHDGCVSADEFGRLAYDCGTVALSKQQCRAMLWAEEVKCRFTFEARRIVLRPRKRRTPA